jgi:hypothetical protein
MKHRKLSKNQTLQKVFRYLRGARSRGDGTVTTRDILIHTGICAVNSVIGELRENGCEISCEQRRDADGKPRWHYRLEKEPENG